MNLAYHEYKNKRYQYLISVERFRNIFKSKREARWWFARQVLVGGTATVIALVKVESTFVMVAFLPPHPSQLTKYKISYNSETKMLNYQLKSSLKQEKLR